MELDPTVCADIARTCVGLQLRKTSRAVTQFYDEALRPGELRITQFPVLIQLSIDGSATITKLAQDLSMDRTSLTRLLKPLETRGLIRTSAGDDRRTRELRLTTSGRETLAAAIPAWQIAQDHILSRLGPTGWRDLQETLSAASRAVRQ